MNVFANLLSSNITSDVINLEFILIVLAFLGLIVATYQLTRIRMYLGRVSQDDLGAILSDYATLGFAWLALLAGFTVIRRLGFITDDLRDNLMVIILALIVFITWSLVYRLHKWYKLIIKRGE